MHGLKAYLSGIIVFFLDPDPVIFSNLDPDMDPSLFTQLRSTFIFNFKEEEKNKHVFYNNFFLF